MLMQQQVNAALQIPNMRNVVPDLSPVCHSRAILNLYLWEIQSYVTRVYACQITHALVTAYLKGDHHHYAIPAMVSSTSSAFMFI